MENLRYQKNILKPLRDPKYKQRSYSLDRVPAMNLRSKNNNNKEDGKKENPSHILPKLLIFKFQKPTIINYNYTSTQITHTLLLVTAKIKHSEKRSFEKRKLIVCLFFAFMDFYLICHNSSSRAYDKNFST